jgi:hypothetical protein
MEMRDSRGSLPRDPLSQPAKPLRNGSAHPPLHTPRREHLGELCEQAGNEQPMACSGVISAGEHPGLMHECLRSVKRSSSVTLLQALAAATALSADRRITE